MQRLLSTLDHLHEGNAGVCCDDCAGNSVRASTHHGMSIEWPEMQHCRQEDMLESIIDSIAPSTNELSQDVNGNHVIAQLLDIKLDSVRKPLLEEIVKHCIEVGGVYSG